MSDTELLRVENLKLHFRTTQGVVQAVDGVDFNLTYNRAVVIVGESGCGKTSWQEPSYAYCLVTSPAIPVTSIWMARM